MATIKLVWCTLVIVCGIGIEHVEASNSGVSCNGSNGTKCDPCGISGQWRNDLGSFIEVTCQSDVTTGSTGYLNGKYNSAVGNAEDFYELSGRYTMIGSDCIVGFNVAWNNDKWGNSNSATSFSGIYYSEQDTIYTHWFLTSNTNYNDMWKNTNVGKNVFTRVSSDISDKACHIHIPWLLILSLFLVNMMDF